MNRRNRGRANILHAANRNTPLRLPSMLLPETLLSSISSPAPVTDISSSSNSQNTVARDRRIAGAFASVSDAGKFSSIRPSNSRKNASSESINTSGISRPKAAASVPLRATAVPKVKDSSPKMMPPHRPWRGSLAGVERTGMSDETRSGGRKNQVGHGEDTFIRPAWAAPEGEGWRDTGASHINQENKDGNFMQNVDQAAWRRNGQPGFAEGDIRAKVVAALEDLSQLESTGMIYDGQGDSPATVKSDAGASASRHRKDKSATHLAGADGKRLFSAKHALAADDSIQISRSIVKKLYRKNVDLEKEVQLLQVQQHAMANRSEPQKSTPSSSSTEGASAVEERERNIRGLQLMTERLNRKIAELEAMLAVSMGTSGGGKGPGRGVAGRGSGSSFTGPWHPSAADPQVHLESYQKIRADYLRLLNRKIDTLKKRGTGSKEVRGLISEMNLRLSREMVERETESALFNAKLYQTEQRSADWYVERRLMGQRILKLEAELAERDRLDAQIETCVSTLFEKMRFLEMRNKELSARLDPLPNNANSSDSFDAAASLSKTDFD